MHNRLWQFSTWICLLTGWLAWALVFGPSLAPAGDPQPDPKTLQSLGGKWFVSPAPKPIYYYLDDDRYVDLFSYHAQDSNKDGIPNLILSHDEQSLIIDSQGYPNHPTAIFPNSGNPNTIKVQKFRFRLPLVPRLNTKITRVPMGPIGMALNGVVFFNPFEMGGMNAVEGYSEVWLDSCCGHPQQTGVYHYHKFPSCVKSPFPDEGKRHSPVIGFAFDGYPIYGPFESDEVRAKDLTGEQALDVCNGHTDQQRGYHYHVTPGKFPYIIGGYAGVPDVSNSPPLRRSTEGAIENNAEGTSHLGDVITSVRPGNAARGQKHTLIIELEPKNARREQVPPGKPNWVQLGPYEAKSIVRSGNQLSVEIEIPTDANLATWLDCHLEFPATNAGKAPIVFKRNDAFGVVDAKGK